MRVRLAVLLVLLGRPAGGDEAARAYVLATGGPGRVPVGATGTLTVAIRCEPGVHVQRQGPLRATASASPGLALAKARLGWEDAVGVPDGRSVELHVSFTASAPGAAEVRLHLEFFVCSRAWCVRQEREVVIPVVVRAENRAAADARP